MTKKKGFILKKIFQWFLILLIAGGCCAAYIGYKIVYAPNVTIKNKTSEVIRIPTGSAFEDVIVILSNAGLKNKQTFTFLAGIKKYKENIKPGQYRIPARASNNEIINMLRGGFQESVALRFTNIRTKEQLISRICKKIEADSTELLALLDDDQYLREKLGLKSETVLTLFIPNTYKFYWNTSAKQFLERMQTEYKKFWTTERKSKAKQIGLSQTEVSILASIVQSEQLQFPDERPIIAGLYLNRLRINMPLQSDPTVIYAIGDFTRNRVLDKDKAVNSPYNTYRRTGLPPGPIYIPEISSINAVLDYQKNNFLYMCAKEDFSGRHNFASTLNAHNRNATKYRNALNKCKIMR